MNFRMADLHRIATGKVTLAFRRWKRPYARAGGTITTAVGVLAIESVERASESEITAGQARRAGYAGRRELIEALDRHGHGNIYRISVRLIGEDPRIALRQSRPDRQAVAALAVRLARMDGAASGGPWTLQTLKLIGAREGERAADLADRIGQERDVFKRNVRKLKNLGLTESLEVGYRLSPRGRALLNAQNSR